MPRLCHHASIQLARSMALAVLVVAMLSLPACNIVGGAAYLIAGPEKVPKLYDLDRTKKTVIFIDDRRPVVNSRVNRVRIGTTAERRLLDNAKIERIISSQDVLAIAEREKGSKLLGMAELGEAVGADVIICAQMESFSLTQDGQTYQPAAAAKVKVIDVTTKKRLFPGESQEWYLLSVAAPTKQGSPPASVSEVDAAFTSLAERFGTALANVFIQHEARTQDGRIDQ